MLRELSGDVMLGDVRFVSKQYEDFKRFKTCPRHVLDALKVLRGSDVQVFTRCVSHFSSVERVLYES